MFLNFKINKLLKHKDNRYPRIKQIKLLNFASGCSKLGIVTLYG